MRLHLISTVYSTTCKHCGKESWQHRKIIEVTLQPTLEEEASKYNEELRKQDTHTGQRAGMPRTHRERTYQTEGFIDGLKVGHQQGYLQALQEIEEYIKNNSVCVNDTLNINAQLTVKIILFFINQLKTNQ